MGEEPERSDGPILNEAQWEVLLRQTGFSGLDGALSDSLGDLIGPALGSVMFSTATKGDSKWYAEASLLLPERSQNFKMEPSRSL